MACHASVTLLCITYASALAKSALVSGMLVAMIPRTLAVGSILAGKYATWSVSARI